MNSATKTNTLSRWVRTLGVAFPLWLASVSAVATPDVQSIIDTWNKDRPGGVAVAWVDEKGVQFFQTGHFAKTDDRPVTPDTQFEIGSVTKEKFNPAAALPFELRVDDFQMAMQDAYDFFFDVNSYLTNKGLQLLDDMLRPAILSGVLSDMLTASLAKHSRALTENLYFNGHPDLIVRGVYANNSVKAGTDGVEIKTTRKAGGAVDTHGARNQWLCVFVHNIDRETEPALARRPLTFTELYLGKVTVKDFRKNPRGKLGTRTATLHKKGLRKIRANWIYRI